MGYIWGGNLLEMDPLKKFFTPALRLLTYMQQLGAKNGLISSTVSEICGMAHLTLRKRENCLNISPPPHVNFWV